MASNVMPRPGDVVTLRNERFAVVSADGLRLELLRLNEPAMAAEAPRAGVANVMTVRQVAEELGVAEDTVRQQLQEGRLRGEKVGSVWRVLRSENPILCAG